MAIWQCGHPDYFGTVKHALKLIVAICNADTLLFLQLTSPTIDSAYSSVALHPDGQILGTGTDDAVVHVWETRSQNVRHNSAMHPDVVGKHARGCA